MTDTLQTLVNEAFIDLPDMPHSNDKQYWLELHSGIVPALLDYTGEKQVTFALRKLINMHVPNANLFVRRESGLPSSWIAFIVPFIEWHKKEHRVIGLCRTISAYLSEHRGFDIAPESLMQAYYRGRDNGENE